MSLIMTHLTVFSRLLARHGSRCGLPDRKGAITPPAGAKRRPSVDHIRPSGAFRRLTDALHRSAHRACRNERIWLHQMGHYQGYLV